MRGVDTMSISIRLSDEESKIIKAYAVVNNISLSDLIRTSVLEKIEDEYDLKCYNKAIKEYENNPVTYTLEEVKKELNF